MTHPHSDVIKGLLKGKTAQYKVVGLKDKEYVDLTEVNPIPYVFLIEGNVNIYEYRIKPVQ